MLSKDIKISLTNLVTTDIHIHSGLQCIFMLRGQAAIDVEGERIQLATEDLLVINSNRPHTTIAKDSNVVLILEIQPGFLRNQCEDFANGIIRCHCIGHSDESSHYYGLKRALTRMLYTAIKKESGYQLDFKVELLRFIHILFTNFRNTTEEEPDPQKQSKNINHILSYLEDNFYHPIKLEEMARREHMSPQYFSKYFKRKTGYGFLEYLTSLRLKRALQSVLETDESIIKIALDHGFANAKSFTTAFKKEYNDTPGNFRKSRQGDNRVKTEDIDIAEINLNVDIELRDFMQYMKKYDINFEQTGQNKVSHTISLNDREDGTILPSENILNIGKAETAIHTNLIDRLDTLHKSLGFKYIHFDLEHHFIPNNIQYSLIVCQQFFRLVDAAKQVGMIPFLKIAPDQAYRHWSLEEIEAHIREQMNTFLFCVTPIYEEDYLNQWKIQVYPDQSLDSDVSQIIYETVYDEVKKKLPQMEVGYHSLDGTNRNQKQHFSSFLTQAHKQSHLPDFITFGIFANDKKKDYLVTQFFFPELKNYYSEVINTIHQAYESIQIETPTLYMSEWNTLMGDLDHESILYLRSAIILDALLEVNPQIKGIGCWADSSVSAIHSDELPITSLSLYLIDEVRRPIYTILEIMKRLGSVILYQKEDILVTLNDNDEYNVLVWNAQYLNPSYCMDDPTTKSLYKNINVKLTNMKPGNYQIKKVTCNKENSGVITQIINAGYADFSDREVFNYIKYNIAHGLNVYEESIMTGSYLFNTNLSYNGVVLYIIKKQTEIKK